MQKARALFGVLDGRELNTPRPTLALEQAPAVTEADGTDEEWAPQANYSFSVVPPEAAKTLRAKHLFLCGFNSEADKTGLLCYPNALAEQLKLPTLNEKKLRAAQSVTYALNFAAHTAVTYSYLNLEGKETAEAALIQLLGQVLPEEKQHTDKEHPNYLLKSYEVIGDAMPDPSWTAAQVTDRKANKSEELINMLFAQTQTCGELLKQVKKPRLVACDTMNYWISSKKKELLKVIKQSDILFLNETEARQLTGIYNLIKAGKSLLKQGVKYVIIKLGSNGSMLVSKKGIAQLPPYLLEQVHDTTGAGDTFGGGFTGYLASLPRWDNLLAIKRAMMIGNVMASFTIESFSVKRLAGLTQKDIDKRLKEYTSMLKF